MFIFVWETRKKKTANAQVYDNLDDACAAFGQFDALELPDEILVLRRTPFGKTEFGLDRLKWFEFLRQYFNALTDSRTDPSGKDG